MKITKKILCFVLAAMMAVGCVSVSAAEGDGTEAAANTAASGATKFSDVGDNELYSSSVRTLNLMGVINGYPDGTFKPNDNVTRAEFTAMLMRTLKLGNVGSNSAAGLPFTDIDDNNSDINWAIPNINTAYGKGVINGYEDGTFRPNDNVAYEEAIKMIVCTLGYGDGVDVSLTPWYTNYLTIAAQRGITKTASRIGGPETPASRACIAQLLYDSLEVKLIENGEVTDKTILNSYLGYNKCTGVISSNRMTSLSEPDVNLRENEIQISAKEDGMYEEEVHTYSTDDTSLNDYLGYQVEFYYKSDGSDVRELMLCVVKDNEPVTVNAKNIELRGTTSTQIKYYQDLDDTKEKNLNLENDNVVIYNGKLYGANAASSSFDVDMVPTVGEIKLIDSDSNGKYDVVDITSYEIYHVSSKSAATYEINDDLVRTPSDKTIKLDPDTDSNLMLVNKSGTAVSFSSIAVGNIVCVAKSNDNGGEVITRAVVLTDKVTGTITAIDGDDSITISGKEYNFSKMAPWITGATDKLETPKTQDSGTYYLDINGDIVAYSKNVTSENMKYGYIMGYSESKNSFDGDVQFRVLTSTGSVDYIGTYKSTRVDGDTCNTGVEVLDKLLETAENQNTGDTTKSAVQQVIKYTTRTSDGHQVFDKILTAKTVNAGADVVSDKLTMLAGVKYDEPMTYNSTSRKLTNDNNVSISIGNSIIFVVPEDRESYDDFRKSSVSTIFKNGVSNYSVEAFDVTSGNAPKVVVAYGASSAQAVDSSSPVYVLDEIYEDNNSAESSVMNRIKGFKSSGTSASATFDEWVSDDTSSSVIRNMEAGDIFRAGTDRYGYTVVDSDYIIYKMNGSNSFGMTIEPSNQDMYDAEFVSILGSVAARDDESVSVAPEELSADDEYDTTTAISFNITDFEGAQVLVYDTTGQKLEIVESDYESALGGLTAVGQGTPSKVLIYMSEGKIKLLCVLPQ